MRIKEELDATEVMAVDSIQYHVVPRVLALTLASAAVQVAERIAGDRVRLALYVTARTARYTGLAVLLAVLVHVALAVLL